MTVSARDVERARKREHANVVVDGALQSSSLARPLYLSPALFYLSIKKKKKKNSLLRQVFFLLLPEAHHHRRLRHARGPAGAAPVAGEAAAAGAGAGAAAGGRGRGGKVKK